ncbi:MAG: TIGR04282 family arsenosugar biosynthesis glycosyltransferase [Alphaproteobacteria bacterium]|jgi:hypothetical protein|nr:TIGR04282 family arsenosugar biosynthesis glycosyltransferase [Alphaproteobacteria bacterium]
MRQRPVVIVFAKAPRLGAVKSRLARDIGPVAAWRFQRDTGRALVQRLAGEPRWHLVLAVTPDLYQDRGRFWPAGITRLAQGDGDLGRRMARALDRFLPAPVVLVGSDIPTIGASHIHRAFRILAANSAVFGPAADGGYWLVGLRGRVDTDRLFREVRWSSPHALADTLRNLGPGQHAGLADELGDVDCGSDFDRWREGRRG